MNVCICVRACVCVCERACMCACPWERTCMHALALFEEKIQTKCLSFHYAKQQWNDTAFIINCQMTSTFRWDHRCMYVARGFKIVVNNLYFVLYDHYHMS